MIYKSTQLARRELELELLLSNKKSSPSRQWLLVTLPTGGTAPLCTVCTAGSHRRVEAQAQRRERPSGTKPCPPLVWPLHSGHMDLLFCYPRPGFTCAPRCPTSLVAPFLPPLQAALNNKSLEDTSLMLIRAWAVSFMYVASFIITGGVAIVPS